MKPVPSSVLTRAMRQELVMRNDARLAEVYSRERQPITPWTMAEPTRSSMRRRMMLWVADALGELAQAELSMTTRPGKDPNASGTYVARQGRADT
jgi:hypothetical protein